MEVWRLASRRFDPLSGEDARLVGGRWNSAGRPVVYASESLALCVVEAIVHITGAFPVDYAAFCIGVPDSLIEHLDSGRLKGDWAADLGYTRAIGDQWCEQARSLALVVPSAVIPASANILLNPVSKAANHLRVLTAQPFQFDPPWPSSCSMR